MTQKISIRDIAKRLDISITTVSFVINGKGKEKHISEELIKKILNLVDELGYRPNAFAKSLRTGKSNTLGFLVDNISDPFFSAIAHLIDEKASRKGYKILFSSTGSDTNKVSALLDVFKGRHVDGYIIAMAEGVESEILQLVDSGVPVVLFDRYLPEIAADYILVDNFGSTFNATRHLIKNGYRHCAFITSETTQQQMTDRLDGYRKAVLESGYPEIILKLKYSKPGSTVNTIREFLTRQTDIDAVIFGANYITMEGLRVLKCGDNQLREDLAIISFDDFELLEFLSPTVTAIEQPLGEIAEHIVGRLLEKLEQKETKLSFCTVNIPCRLNERRSSLPKKESPELEVALKK